MSLVPIPALGRRATRRRLCSSAQGESVAKVRRIRFATWPPHDVVDVAGPRPLSAISGFVPHHQRSRCSWSSDVKHEVDAFPGTYDIPGDVSAIVPSAQGFGRAGHTSRGVPAPESEAVHPPARSYDEGFDEFQAVAARQGCLCKGQVHAARVFSGRNSHRGIAVRRHAHRAPFARPRQRIGWGGCWRPIGGAAASGHDGGRHCDDEQPDRPSGDGHPARRLRCGA